MLSGFRIQNFKSYKDTFLDLAPLTVLIGANASGKSNAIEALRLMSWIAQGNKLGAVRYAVQEQDHAIRGKVGDLGFRGTDTFTFSCRTTHEGWDSFEITLRIGKEDELHIKNEKITGTYSSVPLYEVIAPSPRGGSDLHVAYNNFARGGKKPRVVCNDQLAVFLQLQSSARFEGGHKKAQIEIPKITRIYEEWLSRILFLDPRPSVMRDYSFKTDKILNESGKNISGVLYNMFLKNRNKEIVLDFIKSLPEQNICDMDFIETHRGEVMIKLKETFGGEEADYDATLLSDGTLRVLSIAAAILSAQEGSLVIIEEIDNGVHPSRAEHLLNGISMIAKDRGLRVLISSHNPALLDALPDDAVPDVVFCYRDPDDGASRLVRLGALEDYPELIAQGPVGHLMTRGLIERFVKYRPRAEERKKISRAWLEKLRVG